MKKGQIKKTLRWLSLGHSVGMVAQYVDLTERQVKQIQKDYDADNASAAKEALFKLDEDKINQNKKQPRKADWKKDTQKEKPFKQPKAILNKDKPFDKKAILKRVGDKIEPIPTEFEQELRKDGRSMPWSELFITWKTRLRIEDEEEFKRRVKQFSSNMYKSYFVEDGVENA